MTTEQVARLLGVGEAQIVAMRDDGAGGCVVLVDRGIKGTHKHTVTLPPEPVAPPVSPVTVSAPPVRAGKGKRK